MPPMMVVQGMIVVKGPTRSAMTPIESLPRTAQPFKIGSWQDEKMGKAVKARARKRANRVLCQDGVLSVCFCVHRDLAERISTASN